jgi:hypothetical protein
MNHDPETRAFLIATGNCSALVGTHRNGGVLLDSNGAVVPPHYDDYAGIAFLAAERPSRSSRLTPSTSKHRVTQTSTSVMT